MEESGISDQEVGIWKKGFGKRVDLF